MVAGTAGITLLLVGAIALVIRFIVLRRLQRFEVAHGGTIFLDEIGEISPATQVNLLRVLDTSVFRHVGGTSEIRVDVRVLAATNRDLRAMVAKGLFREDLFYRMSTITLEIPPLRQRGVDIELLARHFVGMLNERYGSVKVLGESTLAALRRHYWPGNVRELLHAVEAAVVVCEGSEILVEHLPQSVQAGGAAPVGRDGDCGCRTGRGCRRWWNWRSRTSGERSRNAAALGGMRRGCLGSASGICTGN